MGSLSPSEYVVSRATAEDTARLIEIVSTSYSSEAICRFYFNDWPSLPLISKYFQARVEVKIADPDSVTYKVTNTTTNEILGTLCVTLRSEVRHDQELQSAPGARFTPMPGVNMDLVKQLVRDAASLEEVVAGKKHLGKLISHSTLRKQ